MTHKLARISAIALGVAAFVASSPLSAAYADTSPAPAPASSTAAPSLSEPSPTPGWAESGPARTRVAQHPSVGHYAHRHYASRNDERRYWNNNPVASAATGVAGGVADLGSIAAYPFYCFPNYGACSVRVPYRF